MHNECGDRTSPRRFFEFVGPTPVIGHRAAAKLTRYGLVRAGFEIGIIDEEDCNLAAQVDALEVVPISLRRRDAITDEHHRCIDDCDARNGPERLRVKVAPCKQRQSRAAVSHLKPSGRVCDVV